MNHTAFAWNKYAECFISKRTIKYVM